MLHSTDSIHQITSPMPMKLRAKLSPTAIITSVSIHFFDDVYLMEGAYQLFVLLLLFAALFFAVLCLSSVMLHLMLHIHNT